MDKANMDKLAEELTTCVVCTNKYFVKDECGFTRIPKILDCMHTFCDKCISQHYKECNSRRISPFSNFPCPTCRKTIYVPLKGIEAFPTDIKIKQIIELLQNTANTPRHVRDFCQTCHFKGFKVEGNLLCLVCQKRFCASCRKLHQNLSFFANHSFLNLGEQRINRRSTDSNNECPLHSSELEYFCTNCNKNLCCICAMMHEHRNHNLKTLAGGSKETISENIYDDIGESESLQSECFDESSRKKQTVVAALKQRKDQLLSEVNFHDKQENFKVCEDDINKAYKEAQKILKNQHLELLNKLKQKKADFDKIVSKKDDVLATIKSAEKLLSEEDKVKKGSTDVEKFEKILEKLNAFDDKIYLDANQYKYIFKLDVKVQLGELVLDTQNKTTKPSPPRKNVPLPNLVEKSSEVCEKAKRMSIISQDVQTKTEKGNNSVVVDALLKTLKSLTFKSNTKSTKSGVPSRYAVPNDMWSGLLHWETKSLTNLKNICFVENGEVLIVLDDNCRRLSDQLLGLRSSDGSTVDIVIDDSVEPMDRIRNLCYFNETNHFFLLGYRGVQGMIKKFKITSSKKNTNCTMKCIETIKLNTIKDPIALSVNKKMVAILENGGSQVAVLNSKFEKISQISEGEFGKSNYLSVDVNDRIMIPDYKRREIKVFKNEEMVLKFSSTGPRGEDLLPQGLVVVTKQNNILVADQALSSISLYNTDGQFLEVIVENVRKPWGICYSEAKHFLAVATADALKVYKL